MEFAHRQDVLNTYRYLRLAMVLLVSLLAVAVLWQVFSSSPHCLQKSISAYYFTPARAAFVAALCAIGACLVVYKGNSTTEDTLLNFCGVMSFVVAFVPTSIDRTCKVSNVPSTAELTDSVTSNVWALLIIGVVALVLAAIISPRAFRFAGWNAVERSSAALTSVAVVATVIFFFAARAAFVRDAHLAAALAMFAGIVLVVLTNAHSYGHAPGSAAGPRRYANRYAVVAGVMILTLVGVGAARLVDAHFVHWMFWLEAGIIGEFAVYWAIQTVELWDVVNRAERSPAPAAPASGWDESPSPA